MRDYGGDGALLRKESLDHSLMPHSANADGGLQRKSCLRRRTRERIRRSLLGRWDLTVEGEDGPYPAWLEVRLRTELQLMGRFVGRVGSVRHVSAIDYDDGRLELAVPVQYEPGTADLKFEARLVGDRLEGTTLGENGSTVRWTGARAPALGRSVEPELGAPIVLFNGDDLTGWVPRTAAHGGCWSVADGALVATPPCVDLLTERTFDDFVLHAELMYPEGSNSGVYLRGRYEIQIQDDAGKRSIRCGWAASTVFSRHPSLQRARPASGRHSTSPFSAAASRSFSMALRSSMHSRDPRHHGRSARQPRRLTGPHHAARRPRCDPIPKHHANALSLTARCTTCLHATDVRVKVVALCR